MDSSNRMVFFSSFAVLIWTWQPFGILGFDLLTRSNVFFATDSANPAVSDDGRFLAYMKKFPTPQSVTCMLRDFQTGKETLVSAGYDGNGSSNGRCTNVLISPDARFVVF